MNMKDAGQQPVVYLIGAGPGDPGLLTLRAAELMATADAVVYDYLASDAIRRFANPEACQLFVGKKGFSQHVTQQEINDCLIDLAVNQGYKRIVRLKGGDPFIFGRGGEEALALREAGIDFQVVPGVTAGVAAPAYAGIPVTHRMVASSVTLITGHETPDKNESAINWEHLAQGTDTLCFYMGVRDLPMIVKRLVEGGRPAETPVALVRWGTKPEQEVLVATLDTVVDEVTRASFKAPAIIVVGEVVELRDKLAWFEDRPLAGKRVVVTRSREQASALSRQLQELGAAVVEFPTIAIQPRPLEDAMQSAVEKLASKGDDAFDWLIFTSANGVSCFFSLLEQLELDARVLGGVKVAAIGPATARELKEHGINADLVPPRFVAESVIEALSAATNLEGARILIPRASKARDILPESLRDAGAQVEVLPVYDTVIPDETRQLDSLVDQLQKGEVDAVTFTSSSTARNFVTMMRNRLDEDEFSQLIEPVTCASIGPVTSKTMAENGIHVSVQADTYTIPGLVSALCQQLAPAPALDSE